VRSASGDDGRKLFQCGAQRARIQGPRCNEPVRQSSCLFLSSELDKKLMELVQKCEKLYDMSSKKYSDGVWG
jgi:hypothetical protein